VLLELRHKLARIKLDRDVLGLGLILEKIARVRVKDVFKEDDVIYFIVDNGQLGKAIGKGAENIKKLSTRFNKKIKIIEYSQSPEVFVKNVVYPAKPQEIVIEGENIIIRDQSKSTKSMIIGRGGKNLALVNRAVKRFFSFEVKVE
jgi:N utilization substance protein A